MHIATQHHKKPHVICLSLLTLAVWLCGCSGVSVKGNWEDAAPRHQTYARLLVVGVTPNRDVRCAFESDFASSLASPSTVAITSCEKMSAKEPLTRENVERAASSAHADAVLATRLVSAKYGHGQGNGDDTRGDSVYKATDFAYGAYGMPVTDVEFETAPPLTSLTESIHVVTKVYETNGATLIYTIDTKTKAQEIDSSEDTLETITQPTADRLRRVGLIR
ncbi:MAG: hypothetical protein JO299_07305 [Gammaproteobacteria bacterium]|nr:hypothetical protein [Gammaproteobacteria bacterium]